MRLRNYHFQLIDQWASNVLIQTPREQILLVYDKAFSRIWSKAELTLGNVTLQAVTDRVVSVTEEEFPWLVPIDHNRGGINLKGACERTLSVSAEELKIGLGFLLGEFLTVLGNLTAEVISSKLHAALLEEDLAEGEQSRLSQQNKDSEHMSAKSEKKQ